MIFLKSKERLKNRKLLICSGSSVLVEAGIDQHAATLVELSPCAAAGRWSYNS